MTRINKLTAQGFKSFAKKTEIVFGDDFNVVLGPNGSGKSNVLDAICFVLGRLSTKSLRVEKSSNLIYNGGKKKKPASKAEVSIFFDNKNKIFPVEEEEIKISRVLHKDGHSDYLIDDKVETRQAILDLLSAAKIDPDGYNIILQGDITRFVEMSTNQRREVLEEISGISIYKDKKDKADRELDKVEEKLKEADIILTERKTYLKELKKERDQALKYKEMKDRIDSSKATVLHYQIKEREEKLEALEEKTAKKQEKLDKLNNEIAEIKKQIQQKKERIEKINKEIEEKGEKDQVDIMKKIEELKVNHATDKSKVQNLEQELEKIENRRAQLKDDSKEIEGKKKEFEKLLNELEKKKKQIEKEKNQVEKSIEDFKKDKNLGEIPEIEKEIQEIDKKSDEIQEIVQNLRQEQQNLLREKDRLEYQIENIDQRIEKVEEVENEHQKELKKLKEKRKDFKEKTLELNKRLAEDSSLAAQLSKKQDELEEKRQKLSKLRARSAGIQEKISANIAVKKILEQKKIKGIYGTVGELGNVKSKYATALEIAAGSRINNLVVQDDKVASECIKYLKTNRLGSATFLPLNKLRSVDTHSQVKKLAKSKGSHGLAVDLVDFDRKYSKVFKYLFANTLVIDNIDVARRIGIGNCRMVTLDGDIAETSGAMRGGYRRQKKKGLGFRQKETTKGIDELEKQVNELEEVISVLRKRRDENEQTIDALRKEKATLEGEIIKIEKGLHLEEGDIDVNKKQKRDLKRRLKIADKKVGETNKELSKYNSEFAKLKEQKQKLRDQINELQSPTLLAELNTLEEKKEELREEMVDVDQEISSTKLRLEDMLGPELKKVDKILKQLDKEEKQFEKDKQKTEKQIKEQEEKLEEMEAKQQEFLAKFKGLFNQRDEFNEQVRELEREEIKKEERSRNIEVKINDYGLDKASLKAELSGMQREFEQYQGVELTTGRSEQALKAEITRFKNLVEDMGNVNLKALEIYETVEEEFHNLHEKKDKLQEEKQDVLELMEQIEGKKKVQFMETFNEVNENFVRIFGTLSGKGKAFLKLEEEEDPFAGGVRIKVRIKGRRFMDIMSLSGGEKTLTALAFIFAIQEYEPASFYVLDEVDAALDKKNSEKFAKLVAKYSRTAQYVVITHNDFVISEADKLYGVSMNEHNVSKVVSLKI